MELMGSGQLFGLLYVLRRVVLPVMMPFQIIFVGSCERTTSTESLVLTFL